MASVLPSPFHRITVALFLPDLSFTVDSFEFRTQLPFIPRNGLRPPSITCSRLLQRSMQVEKRVAIDCN